MGQLFTKILEEHFELLKTGLELLQDNEGSKEETILKMKIAFKGNLVFADIIEDVEEGLKKDQLESIIKSCTIMEIMHKKFLGEDNAQVKQIKGIFEEKLNKLSKTNKTNKKPIIIEKRNNKIRITFEKDFTYSELEKVLEELEQNVSSKSFRIIGNELEDSVVLLSEDSSDDALHIHIKNSDYDLGQQQVYLQGFLQFLNK
jgi:PHD/YefM family antitoxin component YafN of YafNO toxin-antitoxin module